MLRTALVATLLLAAATTANAQTGRTKMAEGGAYTVTAPVSNPNQLPQIYHVYATPDGESHPSSPCCRRCPSSKLGPRAPAAGVEPAPPRLTSGRPTVRPHWNLDPRVGIEPTLDGSEPPLLPLEDLGRIEVPARGFEPR